MKYKAVYITLDRQEEADLVTGLLEVFHFDGFEEREHLLIGYCPSSALPKEKQLKEVLKDFSYQIKEVPDQNWNASWEAHFQPVLVGDLCGIRADFHLPIHETQYEIIIHPRMSFGTGHHATTQMMIRLMEDINWKNKKVLDFGTGTGVLSILSAKMGAKEIIAIDNDRNALENAQENVEKNNINGITLFCENQPDIGEKEFDVTLANITKNTILTHAKPLASLNPKGRILLSGFLEKDKRDILKAFDKHGFVEDKTLTEKGWIALCLKAI